MSGFSNYTGGVVGNSEVEQILERGVRERGFPGATYAYGDRERVVLGAVGGLTFDSDTSPARVETVYDLASLTKVLATTPLALEAVRRGLFKLETRVGDVLPEAGVADATVLHLLTHSSGLPPYDHPLATAGLSAEETRRRVIATEPVAVPGEVTAYSCLGFILLASMLERVLGQTLDRLFDDLVARPMGLGAIGYLPKSSHAPTDPALPLGVVHDPLARALGGVSGNAGLFGDVSAVVKAAQWWLGADAGALEWTRRQSAQSTRALGWDTKAEQDSSAGELASLLSFGHTGYTGTSLWVDPVDGTFVALLTNRVFPDDSSRATLWARPQVADASKRAGI